MRTFIRDGIPYEVKLSHWIPKYITRHDAVTWNRVIYVKDATLPAQLHCHEFVHLQQQRDDGLWRWTFRYLWQGLGGYRGISYEVKAYAEQTRYVMTGRTDFQGVS